MNNFSGLPPQKLSFKSKNLKWRKQHIDWAENHIWNHNSRIRTSLKNKIINYNLLDGKLDMSDVMLLLDPNNTGASYIPDTIQHFPIINSKLNVLAGEETKRKFGYKVVVTNFDSISEVEENRKNQWLNDLSSWITQGAESEEEAMRELEKIEHYNKYEWQDIREIRANCILDHYVKELEIPHKRSKGFFDAMAVGEEAYQCDIVGGEPTFDKINPKKMIIIGHGFSNRIEDADKIVLWDYWSPGKIIDTFYDVLKEKDIKYLSDLGTASGTDKTSSEDPRDGYIFTDEDGASYGDGTMFEGSMFSNDIIFDNNHTDGFGNIRVIRFYWKSFREILKVKSYNFESGEEEYNYYPADHIINEDLGEEATSLWINEAWEATKIGGGEKGEGIYLNMRPKVVQYNRLSNPSRCHFGIVGSIYNLNDGTPFSMVDMAKPYSYLYNVTHDRLNKNIAASWGNILKLDLAMVPKGWEIDKWMHFAKVNKLAVTDSFKEGNKGVSTGKLAGNMNNQSSGVITANQGDIIQQDINLLSFIKSEMAEVMGISPQREGQISTRETVGGVERSVLQSSHITEWLFSVHDSVGKRALECFLETAKAALRGRSKKFQYILSDGSMKVMNIDGDEFAESDYGILLDNSDKIEAFLQKMEGYGQALIQNQMISTSTLIKLWNGSSISDITRSVEADERNVKEEQAQQREQQAEQFQAQQQAEQERHEEGMLAEEERNIRDNETKILIKSMELEAKRLEQGEKSEEDLLKRDKLLEDIRQFNEKLRLEREKLQATKKNRKEKSK